MSHHQWHQSIASILFSFIFAFITHFSSSFPPPHPPMDTHLGIFKVCFFCPSAIHLFGYKYIQIDIVKNIYKEIKCCFMVLLVYKLKSVAQSCSTLCHPMDCRPPGSSVRGFFQARMPEWIAISFSRGCSWPRDWTQVSSLAGRLFTICVTREAQWFINFYINDTGLCIPCCVTFFTQPHFFFFFRSFLVALCKYNSWLPTVA